MPSIADIKAQYPELSDLDDEQVVDAVHQAFYADMPRERVAQSFGLKQKPVLAVAPERGMVGVLADAGITAIKGAIGVPEAVVGMADILSGGRVGKALENDGGAIGFRPKQAKQALDEMYSERQKQAFQNVSQAEGIVGTTRAALENPSVIAHAVGESLPMMGMGGLIGRGVLAAAPKVGALGAGAIGEGVVSAGSAGSQIRQQTDNGLLTAEQAALSGATGLATGAFGILGGKVAQRLGIADVDTMLVAAGSNPAARKGIVRSVLEGAASEGLLEELPQSVSEQVLQNKALGRPLDEGVDQAAVLGTLAGAVMGGGANALNNFAAQPPEVAKTPEQEAADAIRATKMPESGPMTRAVNAQTDAQAQAVEASQPDDGIVSVGGLSLVPKGELTTKEDQPKPLGFVGDESTAEQTDDPVREKILALPDGARQDAIRAYAILNRDDLPKGVTQYNRKLLDRLLAKAEPEQADMQEVGGVVRGFSPKESIAGDGLSLMPMGSPQYDGGMDFDTQALEDIRKRNAELDRASNRAERRRTDPVELSLNTDPVAGYINDLRQTNTPAARAYVGEFDAGRVTREDVEQRMQADRGLTADERLAKAAAESLKLNPKGDPFKTLMAAQRAAKTTPGTVIEVPGGYAIRTRSSSYADTQAQDAAAEAGKAVDTQTDQEDGARRRADEEAGDSSLDTLRASGFPADGLAAADSTGEPALQRTTARSNAGALTDEQDAPQQPARAETEAAPAQAPEAARGDGAAAAGVPAARGTGDAQADGLSRLVEWNGKQMSVEEAKYGLDAFKAMAEDARKTVGELERSKKKGDPERLRQMREKLNSRLDLVQRMEQAIAKANQAAATGAGDVQTDGVKAAQADYAEAAREFNAMVPKLKAAREAGNEAEANRLIEAMRPLDVRMRAAQGVVQKQAMKGSQDRMTRETVEKMAAQPVGARWRPSEFSEERGLFWEKTAPNKWEKRGQFGNSSVTTKTDAEMGEMGGTVEMKQAAPATSAEPAQETGKSEQVEPFTHAGLKIQTSRVRDGDTVQNRWVVQSPENAEREARGERQIGGDRIVSSREEAIKAAEQESKRYAEEKTRKAEIDAREKAERDAAEAKKEANRGKTLLERRADAILDKPGKYPPSAGLGTGTKREAMDKAIEQGRLVTEVMVDDTAAKKRDQDAVDAVRRAGYILGLSNENIPVVKKGLEAQARLKEGKYQKPEYRVYAGRDKNGPFIEITKTEYDYVQKAQAAPRAESKPDQENKAQPVQDDMLPAGWDSFKTMNGNGPWVYRFDQDRGQPFAVVTQIEGMKYEVQIRHGDKQLIKQNMIGARSEALEMAKKELDRMTAADSVTHQDPGEKPEAATKGVVNDSLKTAAKNEDAKPSEMRKWLLAEIDKELLQASDRADFDEAVKRMGEKDAISMFTGNGMLGKNSETGFITFDVPGDGKFKVRNSVRGLLEFRKNVSASLGFKDSGQKTVKPEQNEGVRSGSGGQMAAITNMIEEGDFEAARDYADAVGIKLEDVKVPRGERAQEWAEFMKTGKVPEQRRASREWTITNEQNPNGTWSKVGVLKRMADGVEYVATVRGDLDGTNAKYVMVKDGKETGRMTSTQPFSRALEMAEDAMPEANDKPAPSKASDTGWNVAGTGYGGKRYRGRNITTADGREIVARVYENAGNYDEVEVKVDGVRKFTVRDSYNAQDKADAFVKALIEAPAAEPAKAPARVTPQISGDPEKFIKVAADSVSELRKSDVDRVLTETPVQFRVEVARHIKDSRKDLVDEVDEVMAELRSGSAKPAPAQIPEGYKPAGEPFYRGGKLTQGYAPFAPGERVTMKDSAGQSGVVESLIKPDDNGVFESAAVRFDNGTSQAVPLGKLVAATVQAAPAATGPRRDPAKVSMFNPYEDGDIVTINGQDWTVKQDTPGWYLTNTGNWRGQHPTIRNIKAMADLIRAVEQAANAAPATPEPESPKLTEAEAKELMAWESLGTRDGVTKHILTFYESKADKDAKRGRMIVATITKGDRSATAWMVDGDDKTFGPLSLAKKRGMEVGMARAVKDGYVQAGEATATPQPQQAQEQAPAESLNKPHTIDRKRVLTPAGAIRAEARNSDADSSVWYYQGDIKMLPMTASVKIGGQLSAGADNAKRIVTAVSSAQKKGWELRSYRAGTLGTVWTLEKDGQFLTKAGLENINAEQIADPKIPNYGAGYDNMLRGQKEFAAALFNWLKTLPKEQRENQAVVSRKMTDVLGGWAYIDRDKLGLHVRYLPSDSGNGSKAVRWTHTIPMSDDWTGALQKVEELAGQKFDAGTQATSAPEPTKTASKTPTVDRHKDVMQAVREGKAGAEQFKASFEDMVNNKAAVLAELGTMTKAQLLDELGGWYRQRYANEPKGEVVDAVYRGLVDEYVLGETLSYGMGKGAYEAAVRKVVDATDDAKLAKYVEDRKAAIAEALENHKARAAALENPQTLDDFRSVVKARMLEGKNRKEAFLSLTPEQRIKYDELEAESTKEAREARKRAAKTDVRAAGQTTGGEIIATKHTRDGYDLFVVQLADRLSKEDYNTVLASAKRLGGWYSSFRGNGAIPGFQFKDKANAEAFLKLAGGDTTDAQAQAQQRRDAFDDDRSQSAMERLREMADKIEASAEEDLSRERKTNTARRARFAANAERAAAAERALARTMRNIAQAIEDGKAKFLDAVRTKTQVEALAGYVNTAKGNELRAKYPSYADQEKRRGEPPSAETADFAEFPSFTAYRSDLAALARQMLEVEGTKKLGAQLMKVADDVTDAYIEFAKKPENLLRLSTFSVKRGDEVRTAIFASRDIAEQAIKRSGLTGKAIVLAEKRGVNRIIMSPSEAMNQKIWTGDGDKRITLTVDFGNELVEAIGRRGSKQNGLTVPWQFQTAHDRRKALARMGIETAAEFRSALREFISLQERSTANKVREMELAMVGRKSDGLDFFPTPAEVADQMVEAADIKPDMEVLEPSAGMGHIADRINDSGVSPDVVEMAEDRRDLLTEKGYELVGRDFLELGGKQYDRIVMNPPFSKRQDAEHVMHAYKLLKPGGRIVAIMGEGVFFGQDKKAQEFREWLDSVGGTSEKLPEGSFMDPSLPVNTSVNARMVVIDKPAGDLQFSVVDDGTGPADTADYGPATQAHRDAVAAVRDSLNARRAARGKRAVVWDAVAPASGAAGQTQRAIAGIAKKLFGVDVVWVSFSDTELFNGAISDLAPGKVFINIRSQKPFMAVLGHELLHHMAKVQPAMYANLSRRLDKLIKNEGVYADRLRAKYAKQGLNLRDADIREELEGDIVGDNFEDLEFWQAMGENQPGLFKRIVNFVTQWLDNLANKVAGYRPFGTDEFLTDIAAAREAVASAMREFSGAEVGAVADPVGSDVKLSPSNTDSGATNGDSLREFRETESRLGGYEAYSAAKDADATELTYKQWVQVRTPSFKKWWGYDWETDIRATAGGRFAAGDGPAEAGAGAGAAGSGRQDARGAAGAQAGKDGRGDLFRNPRTGEPRVFFHGTRDRFTVFDVNHPNKKDHGWLGRGHYFTTDSSIADIYARNKAGAGEKSVMEVFVRPNNPKLMTVQQKVKFARYSKDGIDKLTTVLKQDGHGGAALQFEDGEIEVMTFDPAGIKSATDNGGAFDDQNPDIRFSVVDDIKKAIPAFDVKTAPKNSWAHYRGMAMQALGRRQIVDLYAEELPQLEQYDYLVQQMDAEKNDSGAEADKVAQDWGKLKDEKQLAELMHDATLAQIDPAKPMEAGVLQAQYRELKARFDALTPEAQNLYRQARDMYEGHYRKVQKAIKERIERSEMSSGQKRQIMARMDEEMFKQLKGVYFPLARFGQYVIVVKDANGEVKNVTRAESVSEAEEARKELHKAFPREMGYTVGKVLKQAEFNAGRDAVGKGFMADLMDALDAKGIDDELRDTVAQLYLSSLPDLSWAKHGIHRKGTPGFSQDARRAFAQNMFHGARYLAKLRYADQLQDELIAMQDHVKAYDGVDEYDSIQAQQVVDEMVKRHEIMMNPKSSPVSTALTSLGFVFHLGLSPASAMVNLSQTALVAYPMMGAKWGWGKASAALLAASQDVVKAKNNLGAVLKGAELDAYERAVKDGTIDVTMAHDLAGISQGEDQKVMWRIRPVMRAASFMFHHAERFNRQATFIAAWRMAKEAGPDKTADQLYEEAKKLTYDSHFDYSASARPRLMQGNWQRVIFLFKQYGQNMVYTLSRNAYLSLKGASPEDRRLARRALGGILATHAAAAGVLGLPLVGPLLTAASFIGSDDDEPWDAEVAMQNVMADMVGPKAAEVMARGLSRLTPFDLSGRVALNKLILPDVQEGLEGQRWAESLATASLGPVAGIGVNMARGLQKITEGHYMMGFEDMMPTALRGPLRAIRYASEGAVDKTGVVITDEVGPGSIAGQALGFSPSDVRRATERKAAIMDYDRSLADRRSSLVRQWAEAQMAGDTEGVRDVMAEIQGFNQKNPNRRITMPNLIQSVRARRRRIEQAEDGVYLPKNRDSAREAVRF